MSVWRRLQRFGKKAAKFQFTISLQELCIECNPQYKPGSLVIIWSRRSRRYASKPIECKQSEENLNVYNHIWAMPENMEFTTTLYRSEKALQFEEKEWICQVEDLGSGASVRLSGPSVRRRVLATRQIELSEFTSALPTQTSLKINMRLASKKLISASLLITLHSVIVKEGDASDEDMISVASLMSLSRAGSFSVGSGLTVNDVGGIGSASPGLPRFSSARYPVGYASKLSPPRDTYHNDISVYTAKLQALGTVPDEQESVDHADSTVADSAIPKPTNEANGGDKEIGPQLPSCGTLSSRSDQIATKLDPKVSSTRSGQDLLVWCQDITRSYASVHVTDLTTSFQSGLAFCAILHHFYPDKIDFSKLSTQTPMENCRLAFDVAAKLGIPRVLDPVELTCPSRPPDLLSMMTYLHQIRTHCTGLSQPDTKESRLPAALHADLSIGVVGGRRASDTDAVSVDSTQSSDPAAPNQKHPAKTSRRTSVDSGAKLVGADSELPPAKSSQSNPKTNSSMRYEHMLAKARSLLQQTRLHQQPMPPYTDALPPLANSRKQRPLSSVSSPNSSNPADERRQSSETELNTEMENRIIKHYGSARHRKSHRRSLMRFNSDGTIFVPNGVQSPGNGVLQSQLPSRSSVSPDARPKEQPETLKVRRLKLSQLNLFASGRGNMAPVPIRIGEHHFSPKHPVCGTPQRGSQTRTSDKFENADVRGCDPPTGSVQSSTVVPSTAISIDPSLSEYIRNEQEGLDQAQRELDEEAASLEQRLRAQMVRAPGSAAEEELLRRWFVLVSRKNALIHRAHQLSIMEKEDNLKRKTQMLREELRQILSVEDFMKTDSDRRREDLLLHDLVKLVNERDDMIKELDLHEQALAEELQLERSAAASVRCSNRDHLEKCTIQ
ncbi:hypothetical protein P879_02960 [Paragonimus westermani]|uniref:EH domain-binding protein 1 n=1 Tax=Paragonimus westermani TaxID=34504 RepID=A0A8T0DWA5_9TREM|nr:hypothetical protein P879_02960 [Paragonimus westermani]